MAFNKSKHIDAALKYLNQGKLPLAIVEYQQILKNEPKDQVTLMTLGDLFVRQGETFRALEYFERLAQIFMNDGFTTKAIAIYKKVAKLAPEESRPLERLAELYVQQGVLSEARPLYLQLAEIQLKAGKQPQAAALLRKLLEAEPDNLRVQTRLGELHLAMGQEKEAIETFYSAVQRVFERGDHAEAVRLAERILQIDAQHQPTLTLKARVLSGAGKNTEAAALLESLPEQDAGGDITSQLLEQYLNNGQTEKATALAERVFASSSKNYAVAHHVATVLLEAGDLDRAQKLLALIRDTMIDSGDHESLAQTFSRLAELRPGQIEPLEWLVDLYGRASDSFRMPDALAQLAQALEATGNITKALETYELLLDRSPEDESTRRQYVKLRAKAGLVPVVGEISPPVKVEDTETRVLTAPPAPTEPELDEETQRYVMQALTDVDLFSSYGLTQKAIGLLETVLQSAPRHAPTLERLLDLSVGVGNDRRTVEIAALLEQIAIERKDRAGAERFAEFRRRFERAAGIPAAETPASTQPAVESVPEFAVPIIEAELTEPFPEAPAEPVPAEQANAAAPVESVVHEVDLSDEWAALSLQLEQTMQETPAIPADSLSDAVVAEAPVAQSPAASSTIRERNGEAKEEEVPAEMPVFDLEPELAVSPAATQNHSLSADSLLAELAGELESVTATLRIPSGTSRSEAYPPETVPIPPEQPEARIDSSNNTAAGPLADLFEEFRSELGELGKEEEDLETHYNLGIAYREMGLLEEAISEFQKVAKGNDKAAPFRYAMQCCTLLGLAFMEKEQPAIAAMWYERALKIPGLDQESILALRYDLGVAQELAGETAAAVKSFSQVYAMNIDYRDVAERISLLGKAH